MMVCEVFFWFGVARLVWFWSGLCSMGFTFWSGYIFWVRDVHTRYNLSFG